MEVKMRERLTTLLGRMYFEDSGHKQDFYALIASYLPNTYTLVQVRTAYIPDLGENGF